MNCPHSIAVAPHVEGQAVRRELAVARKVEEELARKEPKAVEQVSDSQGAVLLLPPDSNTSSLASAAPVECFPDSPKSRDSERVVSTVNINISCREYGPYIGHRLLASLLLEITCPLLLLLLLLLYSTLTGG